MIRTSFSFSCLDRNPWTFDEKRDIAFGGSDFLPPREIGAGERPDGEGAQTDLSLHGKLG
jgi:hypothetical protein